MNSLGSTGACIFFTVYIFSSWTFRYRRVDKTPWRGQQSVSVAWRTCMCRSKVALSLPHEFSVGQRRSPASWQKASDGTLHVASMPDGRRDATRVWARCTGRRVEGARVGYFGCRALSLSLSIKSRWLDDGEQLRRVGKKSHRSDNNREKNRKARVATISFIPRKSQTFFGLLGRCHLASGRSPSCCCRAGPRHVPSNRVSLP